MYVCMYVCMYVGIPSSIGAGQAPRTLPPNLNVGLAYMQAGHLFSPQARIDQMLLLFYLSRKSLSTYLLRILYPEKAGRPVGKIATSEGVETCKA